LLFVPEHGVKAAPGDRVVWEGETPYQFAQIVDDASGERVLRLNEGWATHSIKPGPTGLVGGYWDRLLCLPPAIDKADDGRLAVLGNAGGTTAVQYARFWPTWQIDGVEIDSTVSDLGYRYLGMREAKLAVHTADARPWLDQSKERFDGIIVDAYRQPYIPFHLITQEFFRSVREHLTPGGAVMINVGAPPGHDQALAAIAQTMATVFPVVEQSRVNDFNTIVWAYRDAPTAVGAPARLAGAPQPLTPLCADMAANATRIAPTADPLTDDHAPIEWLTDAALFSYLQDGAPGAER
jgi:spermidine synthase